MIQALAIAAGICGVCASATADTIAEQKIGTVDLQKVFEKYYKTVRSQAALKQEASDLQKERTDMVDAGKKVEGEWQKLIDRAEDQAVSADERAKAKKSAEEKLRDLKSSEQAIQEYDRASAARLQEKQRQRHDEIVKEIRNVLDAEAKAAGYTLVLDVSGDSANTVPVVIFSKGLNDMTEGLIKELNASAPPAAPDDKDAKPAK
jgi:Skp family chaperone for outer membrane proteins